MRQVVAYGLTKKCWKKSHSEIEFVPFCDCDTLKTFLNCI